MIWIVRWLTTLAINGVEMGGVLLGGWAISTALVLYWIENAVGGGLVAARIALHRRWTHKRGHEHPQLDAGTVEAGAARRRGTSFLAEYLSKLIPFTLGHGIFLIPLVFLVLGVPPPRGELLRGTAVVVSCQVLGFLADLPGLRTASFASVKQMALRRMGGVVLVQLSIIFGMGIAVFTDRPPTFFYAFAGLKALADLGGMMPAWETDPKRPPRLIAWLAKAIGPQTQKGDPTKPQPGETFEEYWARTTALEERAIAADEEVVGAPATKRDGRRR